MKILYLLVSGNIGGIERLCLDISIHSKQDNHFYFVWRGGEIANLIAENTNYIHIGNFSYRNFFSEYKELENYCVRNAIDIVVIQHTTWVLWLYGMWLKKTINCRLFVYAHSNAQEFLRNNKKVQSVFLKKIFKKVSCNCDKLIAISNSVKHSVRGYIGSDNKIELCYNGIDTSRFDYLEEQGSSDTIIFVGRLIRQKGVDLLLKAVQLMKDKKNVLIIGTGEEQEALKSLCVKLKLTNYVTFLGQQLNVEHWYAKATVFVHPCICEEGFGVTLVEAMSTGLPCVAFNKGAIPEIIDDNIDGFLVKNMTAQALADKLDVVFSMVNQEKWSAIRKNARKKAELFSIDKMISRQEEIYNII